MGNKIYGFDLDKFSSDEIIEKIGLNRLSDEELLYAFLESRDNAEFSFSHEDNFGRENTCLQDAPTAYLVYKRLYYGLSIKHPAIQRKSIPNDMLFWVDQVATSLLFEMLIKDGYYKLNQTKSNQFKFKFSINLLNKNIQI